MSKQTERRALWEAELKQLVGEWPLRPDGFRRDITALQHAAVVLFGADQERAAWLRQGLTRLLALAGSEAEAAS